MYAYMYTGINMMHTHIICTYMIVARPMDQLALHIISCDLSYGCSYMFSGSVYNFCRGATTREIVNASTYSMGTGAAGRSQRRLQVQQWTWQSVWWQKRKPSGTPAIRPRTPQGPPRDPQRLQAVTTKATCSRILCIVKDVGGKTYSRSVTIMATLSSTLHIVY